MTSGASLDVLQLEIEKVSSRIDSLEEQLVKAEHSATTGRVSYLQNTVLELRKERNELRKEKNILLQAQVPGR